MEAGIGWVLKRHGRLPFGGKPVQDIEGLRRIIAKAQELGGEEERAGRPGSNGGAA